MRVKLCCGVWLAMALAALSNAAWGQASKPGTGSVTGHVICGDTQRPARFANVMLYSVPTSTASALPKLDSNSDPAAMQNALRDQMSAVSYVQTQTDIEGSFVAENVPPGDYYVLASVAGYVQPRNLLQAAYDAGEDITRSVTGIPIVHVSAERGTDAEVLVTRGAAVEGHVLWDDGGVVNGADVMVEPTTKEHKELPPPFMMMGMGQGLNGLLSLTDDRGHYRISGLAPGEYTVRAMLQTRNQMSMQRGKMSMNSMGFATPLEVYAPNAFHKSSAKPVTLIAGDERMDEDISFNLSGTHTVSGHVTSAEDHHALSQARVMLKDVNDKDFTRSSGLDSEGSFQVAFVPPGTYTLEVSGGADTVVADTKPGGLVSFSQNTTVRRYDRATQQVLVTDNDVTGQDVELKPSKPGKPAAEGDDGGEQTHVIVETGH